MSEIEEYFKYILDERHRYEMEFIHQKNPIICAYIKLQIACINKYITKGIEICKEEKEE